MHGRRARGHVYTFALGLGMHIYDKGFVFSTVKKGLAKGFLVRVHGSGGSRKFERGASRSIEPAWLYHAH